MESVQVQEFSQWTNESIDQVILSDLIDTKTKLDLMAKYTKYKLENPTLTTETYPLVNLIVGYYSLLESKTNDELKEIMNKNYGLDLSESINKLKSEEILAGLTLASFAYVITKTLV